MKKIQEEEKRFRIEEKYPLPDTIYRAIAPAFVGQWWDARTEAMYELAGAMGRFTGELTEEERDQSVALFECLHDC